MFSFLFDNRRAVERKQQQIKSKTKEIAYDEEMSHRPIYDTTRDKDI